jgi:hypothetical protein
MARRRLGLIALLMLHGICTIFPLPLRERVAVRRTVG